MAPQQAAGRRAWGWPWPHMELAAGAQLHCQRDLLALHGDDRLVDGHVPELGRHLARGPVQAVRKRLPGGHHVAGRRHEHAPVDAVVAQEPVVPACARAHAQQTPCQNPALTGWRITCGTSMLQAVAALH